MTFAAEKSFKGELAQADPAQPDFIVVKFGEVVLKFKHILDHGRCKQIKLGAG